MGKSVESFMKYLAKDHPPYENFDFNVEEEVRNNGQVKVLQSFMKKYHPDKHSNKDMLKKVKMEEITKLLVLRYNVLK